VKDKQEIIIIAAMSENRVIGKDNDLPWSIKEDLKHFRDLTRGWPCVMGRKTWESLPKRPLPGRLNIIISRSMNVEDASPAAGLGTCKDRPAGAAGIAEAADADIKVFSALPSAIAFCKDYEKIFICGGGSIYREAIHLANRIELTLIRQNYDGDVFFPEIDPAIWAKTKTEDFDNFSFVSYSKRKLNNGD
jgi:dihydrofolate reductase